MKANALHMLFFLIAATFLFAQERPAAIQPKQRIAVGDIGQTVEILGDLNIPVGRTVTIKGKKEGNSKRANLFWVEEVDLKKFRVGILVNGIGHWPDGTSAILVGHERGVLRFLDLDDTSFPRFGPFPWRGPYQHVFLEFVVTKVIEPHSLDIRTK